MNALTFMIGDLNFTTPGDYVINFQPDTEASPLENGKSLTAIDKRFQRIASGMIVKVGHVLYQLSAWNKAPLQNGAGQKHCREYTPIKDSSCDFPILVL